MQTQTTALRALVYARVSTEEQGRGYSLPTQVEGCERYAAEHGYRVVGTFTDQHTGTALDRPGIAAMYEALAEHRPQIVVIYDIDRLGREVAVQAIIEHEIARAGARIEYVHGDYKDTPEGELLKLVKASIAQYENRQRVERSRRGKAGRVRAGFPIAPTGKAPFGYDYISEPHKGEFVIHEAQAAIVRQIYDWLIIERLSCYQIARRMWDQGIPMKSEISPAVVKNNGHGGWWPASVRKIIANPVYKGEWYWGRARHQRTGGRRVLTALPKDQWILVTVPAIIDADTWERAQTCLTENKARAARNAKRDYLLRGMLVCSCGRRCAGRYKNHLDRGYYRCPGSYTEGWYSKCAARFSIRQDLLEPRVWERVTDYLLNPDTLRAEVQRQREAEASAAGRRASQLQAIEASIDDVDRKLETLLVQVLDGFPQAIIDRQKNALLAKREDLEAQRRRIEAERDQHEITDDTVAELEELAATVRTALPSLTPAERRRLLELLRVRVDVISPTEVRLSGIIDGSIVNLQSPWHSRSHLDSVQT
jgi:site-specific DNA recombinase